MGGVLDEGRDAGQEWLQKMINKSRDFFCGASDSRDNRSTWGW